MYNPSAHILLKQLLPKLRKKAGNKNIEDFERRYIALFSDIFSRFQKLYGQHENAMKAFEKLSLNMLHGYLKRPTDLKKSDELRELNPGWFRSQEITGMMLYVDRFNKNLNGLLDRADYFEELGINFLHLMPLLESPKVKNDGGYAVSDYRKIDSRFGSNQDFEKVTKALRDKDTLVMLDFVVNHTSDEHAWATKAKAGDKDFQDFYYAFEDRATAYMYERSMPEVFPETSPGNFTFDKEMQRWVMTVFNSYQWDLNYTNPYVLVEMIDNIFYLANMGCRRIPNGCRGLCLETNWD